MSRAALVTIVIATVLAAQTLAAPVVVPPPPTPTPAPALDSAPPCALDWSLPVTPDNQTLILRCYKLLQAAGLIDLMNWPCPTPGSKWEQIFNTYYCWQKNHPGLTPATPMPTDPPPAYP